MKGRMKCWGGKLPVSGGVNCFTFHSVYPESVLCLVLYGRDLRFRGRGSNGSVCHRHGFVFLRQCK